MLITIIVTLALAWFTFVFSTACNRAFVQVASKGGLHMASGFLIVIGVMAVPMLVHYLLGDWYPAGVGSWVFVGLTVLGFVGMVYGLATAATNSGGDGGRDDLDPPPPPLPGSGSKPPAPPVAPGDPGQPAVDEDEDDWDKHWDDKWKDKWDREDEEWRRKWESPEEKDPGKK
jgi:hypothetical protein